MSSSTSATMVLLVLLSLAQLYHGADPLSHKCDSPTFHSNKTYHTNLETLLATLSNNVSQTGFSSCSVGQRNDSVYGLASCRGDAPQDTCAACIAAAAKEIRTLCHDKKTAVIWYDNCQLKYSEYNFLGHIDRQNQFELINIRTLTDNPRFGETRAKFLSNITHKAANSPKFYATEELKLCDFLTLYGMAQCTMDLSSQDCGICLRDAASGIPFFCGGQQGGTVGYGSCFVRYEIYPIAGIQDSY